MSAEPLFSLRAATAGDYRWLWELKRRTMRPYVEQTWGSWDDRAQEDFFRRSFNSTAVQLIVLDRADVGLLHVEREARELFLANIQVLPEFQNRGLGAAVVRTVMESARSLRLPVRLQVLKVNTSARRLYERLGFVLVGETPAHAMLRWTP